VVEYLAGTPGFSIFGILLQSFVFIFPSNWLNAHYPGYSGRIVAFPVRPQHHVKAGLGPVLQAEFTDLVGPRVVQMWCTDWVICLSKKNPWSFRSLILVTAFGRSR